MPRSMRDTLDGGFTERLHVAVQVLHDARAAGFARLDELKDEVIRDLAQRHGESGRTAPSDREVAFGVAARSRTDPAFLDADALEKWASQAVTVYATVELLFTQRASLGRQDALLGEQRRTNDLLVEVRDLLRNRGLDTPVTSVLQ